MPPAPSDLMAGDLKRLEESSQRVAARMDSLDAGMRDLREEFAGFRGRVETSLSLMRWLGVFFAGILVAVVFGAGRVVWDASAMSSEVKQQTRRFDELGADVKQQGKRIDELGADVKQQGKRIDELTTETRQQGSRLDRIGKQLEILIQRTEPKAK